MALLDRVATRVRANLNDLIDRAEHPEKMLKQVILDMENQYMQVKTQVALALADLHLLKKNEKENLRLHNDWSYKAELAVEKGDDDLARAALERSLNYQQLAESYYEQIKQQQVQVESLKSALKQLESKLEEARCRVEIIITQHRRARTANRAADAQLAPTGEDRTFHRMQHKVAHQEALEQAKNELLADNLEGRMSMLERDAKIRTLLEEIKNKKKSLSA